LVIGGDQATGLETVDAGVAGRASERRPWWLWIIPFAGALGVLLVRNAFLFTTKLYEDSDMAAYSIQIEQARRFTLLVGNYSREEFNHPGPAFLYVQSWGESLFWAALRVVPTAWNGQLIALYALYALFAALVVATGYGWTGSLRGAVGVLAVVFGYGALHPSVFSSDWMPYEYVLAYLAFIVAIASVAAGHGRDAWIAALSGWFLIHGHACFLLFVPALSLAALAALAASAWRRFRPRAREERQSLWSLIAHSRRVWVPVLVICVLFALPIVVELILHWPGNFAKYFSYGSSSRSGGHSVAQVADYVLWFWWPHADAWVAPVVLFAVAGLVAWRLPAGPVRRFCVSLIAFDALSTVVFVLYTAVGVDSLNQSYIGYFYWSAPAITVLVIVLGVIELLSADSEPGRRKVPSWTGLAVALTAATAAFATFAMAPQTRFGLDHVDALNSELGPITDPTLPAGVARMAAVADGRPVVLSFRHPLWPTVTGFLVQAERAGVRACVADPGWNFMMTSQFICTPAELANGVSFWVSGPGAVPPGMPLVYSFRRAVVAGPSQGT
jgi:hypothetical protein